MLITFAPVQSNTPEMRDLYKKKQKKLYNIYN